MAGIVKADDDSAKVVFPPPLTFFGTLLLGLVADRIFGLALPLAMPVRLGLAVILIIVGIVFLIGASTLFKRAGTDVKPWKTSSAIVQDGVYRITRNPMYLGMAMLYLGLSFSMASICALILFVPLIAIIQTQVIGREERYLEAKFGQAYTEYKSHVRRWI